MIPFPNFVGPTYRSQSPIVAIEQCMNWYPERIEASGSKYAWALYPTPGLEAFGTLPIGPVRGLYGLDGRMWGVGGDHLYEVSDAGIPTDLGLMARDNNPATMSSSGDAGGELFTTAGDKGYILNLGTNAFSHVVDDVTMGSYLEGYFLGLDQATSRVKYSDLLDGTTWPALSYLERIAASDKLLAMAVSHKEIWMIGSETGEVWYHTGASPTPFEPFPGGFFEVGIAAPFSIARAAGSFLWVSQDKNGARIVVRMNGFSPERVSNHAVEFALQGYTTVADARAYGYQDQGHFFYVVNFPTANATWVLDLTTGQWHERGWWNVARARFDAYRPEYHVYAFDQHLVGDRTTGVIYRSAIDLYGDADGAPLRRVRRAPHLSQNGQRLFFSQLLINMETGVGLGTGQGSDPKVMLRFSDDGGRTWKTERTKAIGKMGEYSGRGVLFNQLGSSYNRVFELSASDPVPYRIAGAFLNVSVENR